MGELLSGLLGLLGLLLLLLVDGPTEQDVSERAPGRCAPAPKWAGPSPIPSRTLLPHSRTPRTT